MDRPAEIRFDNWTLRRQPRELLNDGARIQLQDQPLQALEELVTHPGEVVTREQLIARLWPKRVVDFDTALNAAVRRLRVALQDEAETPRYVETIPRTGYRFIGRVVPQWLPDPVSPAGPEPSAGRESHRRQWYAAAVLLLVVSSAATLWYAMNRSVAPAVSVNPSIAVLPFTDLSPEQDQRYFSDGLTEELLNLLSQSKQLRVIARTSSFSFRDRNVDIPTVAGKLNVTHILEGSVRKSGSRVRVTAQLIDAATSLHLWSQTYDRELNDIFEVQSEIAGSVAKALRIALGASDKPTTAGDARAYEHFLRAHFFFHRRAGGDLERARQYYEQALELEPGFARAWAGLAGVYWIQTTEGVLARDAGLEKLRDAAERALALDPQLAEAHVRLAIYLWNIGDLSGAEEQHGRAAALEPNHPLVLARRVQTAAANGRWDEAIELQRQAAAADPLSVMNRANIAHFLFLAGRFDEARIESLKAVELDPSHQAETLADVLILEQRFDEALRLVGSWPQSAARTQCLALIYHGIGRKTHADAALEELIASFGVSEPLYVAEVYAYRGERDEAFKWLEAVARLGPERRPALAQLSPFLKPLHADARWGRWSASVQ